MEVETVSTPAQLADQEAALAELRALLASAASDGSCLVLFQKALPDQGRVVVLPRAGSLELGRDHLVTRLVAVEAEEQLSDPTHVRKGPMEVRLTRQGDFWTLERGGCSLHVRDSVGVRHLVRLIAEPGREFHALDIAGSGTRRQGATGGQEALPGLDAQARQEYRHRLLELRAEIDEAEARNDQERAAGARSEVSLLTAELSRAAGLGGRGRRTGSHAERARVTATKAIRAAIRRIQRLDAELGAHLERSVLTGAFCSYSPDPTASVTWSLDSRPGKLSTGQRTEAVSVLGGRRERGARGRLSQPLEPGQ